MESHVCRNCGGPLKKQDGRYHCPYCRASYEDQDEERARVTLRSLLDAAKAEKFATVKRVLYAAVHTPYPSSDEVLSAARNVLAIEDHDPLANVYLFSHDADPHRLNAYLPTLSVSKTEAEEIVRWLLPSLRSRSGPALLRFIERNFRDGELTRHLSEAEETIRRLDEGVYEAGLARDVFVAYSSADAEKAVHVVDLLEEKGFACFLALRNLRHGQGAAENYLSLIQEAMASCRVFLFLSSPNSLTVNCDAMRVELPHLVNALPKKHRIQYILSDCDHVPFIVTRTLKSAFPTQSHCRTEEDLLTRIGDLVRYGMSAEEREERERAERERAALEQERVLQIHEAEEQRRRLRREQNELERIREEEERRRAEEERRRQEEEGLRLERERERERFLGTVAIPPAPAGMEGWPTLGERYLDDLFVFEGTVLKEYLGDGVARLRVPRGVTSIDPDALAGFSGRTVVLPDTVTEFPAEGILVSFGGENIEVVPSNPSFASADGVLFDKERKTLLRFPPKKGGSYRVPDSVKAIARRAFEGCASLGGVVLPDGLHEIGDEAFRGCLAIKSFHVPSSVAHIGANAFIQCAECTLFSVDPANRDFASRDGVLFDRAMATLVAYPASRPDRYYDVPDGVTLLGEGAFAHNRCVVEVTLSKTVAEIGDGCFAHSAKLYHVKLSKALRKIGKEAFRSEWDERFLLVIPPSVEEIGRDCFAETKGKLFLPRKKASYPEGVFDSYRGRIDAPRL